MKFRAKVELFTFPQYHEEGELAIMATLKDWLGNNLDKDGYVQGYYADGYILGGVYEAYLEDELVIRGNAKEVAKKINVLKSSLKNHLAWTKSGEKGPNDFKVYHVGYDFKKNLEVLAE